MTELRNGFRREHHRLVMRVLEAMDSEFMASHCCWFGGGTRIVLELDEYRESVDIDFLCADTGGYRAIRETVTNLSFGQVFTNEPERMREIRADRYGVRSWLAVEGCPVKIEIVSEGRIELAGVRHPMFPVEVLDQRSCLAEKMLANADRGMDSASMSRDLVDLAFMAEGWPDIELSDALKIARTAYGTSVGRALDSSLDRFRDAAVRSRCVASLAIDNLDRLDSGLDRLHRWREAVGGGLG